MCLNDVLGSAKAKIANATHVIKNTTVTKIILVTVLIIVAILSAPILNTSDYTHFKHALEWNYFFAVVCFYLLTYFFWRKTPVHTP